MKFFKDLLKKDNTEEIKKAQEAEQEAKREERKKRKQQTTAKPQATTPVKYKKVKTTEVRENKPEDFENKLEDHSVRKETSATTANVEWKKPKEKKVQPAKKQQTKEEDFNVLFGVEINEVSIGDRMNGTVLEASREGYIIGLDGTFVEAKMQRPEYNGELKVGDQLEVVIYRQYDGDYYVSNRRLDTLEMIDVISNAMDADQVVEAKVVGFERNNFHVRINDKIDGQVYAGNIDTKFVNADNAEEYIGNTYDFAVTKKLNNRKFKFELSRKELLVAAQEAAIANLEVGEEIVASNFSTNRGGVEFDYNGVRGFVPLREVSNTFVDGIDDIPNHLDLKAEVPVQVIEIKRNRGVVQLVCSIKSLQPSPWNNFIEKYGDDSVLEAEIAEVRPYGFMVLLDCDVKTLLHKNNMSTEMAAEFKNYNVGDRFNVKIEEIDFDNNRVNITTSL